MLPVCLCHPWFLALKIRSLLLFFVFHSIDRWRQISSCLTDKSTLAPDDKFGVKTWLVLPHETCGTSFGRHTAHAPSPGQPDRSEIKACQIPWWLFPFWVRCHDQRLQRGGSVLSQTSYVTFIRHARSIAKAHIHPCARTHGPRWGAEAAVLSPCV